MALITRPNYIQAVFGPGYRYPTPGTDPVVAPVIYQRPVGDPTNVAASQSWAIPKPLPQQEREQMVGGLGSPIPIIYGRTKVGATVVFVGVSGKTIHFVCAWSEGEIEEVETVYLDDEDADDISGVTVTNYTGTAAQTYPAALNSVFPSYTDDLPNIAYSHVRITDQAEVSGFPNITAIVKGLKVYDSRTATTAYSTNPALCLADFIAHERYGRGRTSSGIDWDSVDAAADVCDEDVSGSARRTIGLAMQTSSQSKEWQEALRSYAGVMLYEDGGKVYMIPDGPRATDHIFTDANIYAGSLTLNIKREGDLPEVAEVAWTDPGGDWRDATTRTTTGDAVRVARYSLPGITDSSEAKRYSVEMLNRSLLCGRTIQFSTHSYGLKVTPGDVMEVTHGGWLASAKFRVTSARQAGPRQWQIAGEAYDEGVYSNAVEDPPDWNDPELADPMSPPVPTGLALNEEVYQLQNGLYASRITAEWDDMTESYPFVLHYLVKVEASGLIYPLTALHGTEWVSPAVKEDVNYTVTVKTVSSSGAVSSAASESIVPEGKNLPPGDVPSITRAMEGAGWVQLRWGQAIDLDIQYYQVRRGTTSQTWNTANRNLGNIDATSYLDTKVPAGTYRYFVKAYDSVGQASTNAAYVDVTVSAYGYEFIDENEWAHDEWTLDRMSAYHVRGQGWYLTPDNDEMCNQGYSIATDSDQSFEELADVPMCLPRTVWGGSMGTAATISAVADSWDLTVMVGGQWAAGGIAMAAVEASGATADYAARIELSTDNVVWDEYTDLNIQGSGRYARLVVWDKCWSENASFTVELGPATMDCNAEEREEKDVMAVPLAGQPATVTLTGSYSAVKDLQLTPEGPSGADRRTTYDNLTTTGFDVYLKDASGAATAGNVRWRFIGV